MDDPIATTYNERCADVYDDLFSAFDPAAIEVLAQLAGGGRVLELGIGTGLIALPLAARGIEVHGIDASPAMVSRLRSKPGGEAIPVTMGDFADVGVSGELSLIFVVFNTFFALQTQADQVRCFRNVAAHLTADGVFVLEAYVPDAAFGGGPLRVTAVETDRVGLKISRHDPVAQRIQSQHVVLRDGEVRLYPVEIRYAWPSELDLMAELAGLRLRHRWSDWSQAPFTAASTKHVSIYEWPSPPRPSSPKGRGGRKTF
jgi:SAM-dependent methyltransferase